MAKAKPGSVEDLIDAWEDLPGGRNYSQRVVQRWLVDTMSPAINRARAALSKHSDDEAVDRFAAAMKAKLAKKRTEGRSGWDDKTACSREYLSQLLIEHLSKGDPIDVANLAMMLHQRGETIKES